MSKVQTVIEYFNPRSPDGERPSAPSSRSSPEDFNPRSPDGERRKKSCRRAARRNFNPRSPDGERRRADSRAWISRRDFNPRSPDGERLWCRWFAVIDAPISIHAPRMGSDRTTRCVSRHTRISIHAPRMGSDCRTPPPCWWPSDFNPRSPDGERPRKWTSSPTIWAKSSIFNTDCIADRR